MSQISDVYDALDTIITTTFPTHKELINPYFPETDAELTYNASFGLAFAEGTNLLGNEDSGVEQRQRVFIITLTRRKFALKGDTDTRKTTEKNLFEDQKLLLDAIAQDVKLGNFAQRALYQSDSGIIFLRVESNRNDILLLRTVIGVDFEQRVTLCV